MKKTVKQNYKLINAKYKLNSSEIKFILICIAQIKEEDKILKEYSIKINEIEKETETKMNETRLKEFAKKLISKPLEIKNNKNWIIVNWFNDIEYCNNSKIFKVTISEKLKPYLLELKERYIKYNLKYILELNSNYSIRIYQLLKEYEKIGKRQIKINELIEILKIPKSYKYADIKRKIIEKAKEEIKEKCDIFFEYKEIKMSRKVDSIIFYINKNKIEKNKYNKYKNFYGKKIKTKKGIFKINFIEEIENKKIKIIFENNEFAIVENYKILKEIAK